MRLRTQQVSNSQVAKPEPAPDEAGQNKWKNDVERWHGGANITRDGASEIAGEQYSAKARSARHDVEQRTNQQRRADTQDRGLRITQLQGGLNDHGRLHELHGSIDSKEECGQSAQDAAEPDFPLWNPGAVATRIG